MWSRRRFDCQRVGAVSVGGSRWTEVTEVPPHGVEADVELEALPLPPLVVSVSVAADRRTLTEATEATQLTDMTEVATPGAEAEANRLLLQLLLRST